jgi:hypothetical protein
MAPLKRDLTKRNHRKKTTTRPLSIFWETVVLPTFAPQNARPFRVPGMQRVWNAEFSRQAPVGFDLAGEVSIFNNSSFFLTRWCYTFLLKAPPLRDMVKDLTVAEEELPVPLKVATGSKITRANGASLYLFHVASKLTAVSTFFAQNRKYFERTSDA